MANICMFSANYLPNVGGIERFSYYVCREWIKKGHHVTLVTNNVFSLSEKEEIDGLTVYRFPCRNFLGGRFPVAKRGKSFRAIDRQLNESHFDFILINARFYFHSIYAARLAQKNSIPCVTVEHGSGHLSVGNKLLDTLGAGFEHALTAVLKHYCHDFYGVSRTACYWSAHFGIQSKGVFYNAVDEAEIAGQLKNPVCSYRKQYGLNDCKIITFTGRLLKEKGLYELLDAVKPLMNVRLFIAGIGPLEKEISTLSRNDVIYLGKLDFSHVIALLGESDIFCLPSYSEGMSTSVLEAVASHCFVVTTANGGAKELISSDEYGLILADSAPDKITAALNKALSDESYRKKAAQKAYERLLESFTFHQTAEKILSVMEEMKSCGC